MANDRVHPSGITGKEFKTYENVRMSGMTNMFDVNAVIRLSQSVLNREKIISIMKNYGELREFYMGSTGGSHED